MYGHLNQKHWHIFIAKKENEFDTDRIKCLRNTFHNMT